MTNAQRGRALPPAVVVPIIDGGAYDVYIGRPGPWGNTIYTGLACPVCEGVHSLPGSTLRCHAKLIDRRIAAEPDFRAQILTLAGKRLGCPGRACTPECCHGVHLAAWANRLAAEAAASNVPFKGPR